MAVDHGLGGKDSKRSHEKREKRAKKQKAFARKALTGGNKKELKFDDDARVEWLTGFRKRKTERRKFGLIKKVNALMHPRCLLATCHNYMMAFVRLKRRSRL
jgi:hypothetical protein